MTRKNRDNHLGERREQHRERNSSEERLAGAPMFQCERQHVAKGLRALHARLSHGLVTRSRAFPCEDESPDDRSRGEPTPLQQKLNVVLWATDNGWKAHV